MKDKLIDTLQERFAHHEMGVDPSTWNAISGQLAAANGSALSDVLKDKFSGHEAPVDPHVWEAIHSQLGQGAATGGGVAAGWWAGGIAAALLVGGLFWFNAEQEPTAAVRPIPARAVPADRVTVEPTAAATQRPVTPVKDPEILAEQLPATKAASKPAAPANTPEPPVGQEVVSAVWQDLVKENAAEPHFSDRVEAVPVYVAPPVELITPSTVQPNTVPTPHPNAPATGTDHRTDTEAEPEPAAESEPEFVEPQQPQIYIPNVFSPQGDGVNDRLKVVGSHYQKVLVRIFSAQSNALVFRADNLDDQWNGRDMNNVPCPEGYYFYAIEVTGADGTTTSKGEVVKLFR